MPSTDPKPKPEEKPEDETNGSAAPKEIGGRGGLDPTRYDDWEIGGKCVDF